MKLLILATAEDAGAVVASAFEELIRAKPDCVVGLAAGETPRPVYRMLCEGRPPMDQTSIVMLDEYVGLAPSDPRSFRQQIRTRLTDPLDFDPHRLHTLDGLAADSVAECQHFEQTIANLGGVDLQLLGLGRNGHVGFNEPGSSHTSRTRRIALADTTRADNAAAFGSIGDVPHEALTQGIGTILEAHRVILLATGSHKARAVASSFEGPVTVAVPASSLQRHPDLTVVLDRAAARELTAQ